MPNKLSTLKGYVRMSWAPENLYNLQRLSFDPPSHIAGSLSFKRTPMTLFQQKWASKKMLRAYHGDWIQERRFRRRFLPNSLPPLQNQASTSTSTSNSVFANRSDSNEPIPLGSLMWREVEARLDVLVFRSCFAHSIYEARRLVTQGHVSLNGKIERDPNILLAPGDILSVDPKEMYLLRESNAPFSTQKVAQEGEEEAAGEQESVEAATEAASEEPSAEATSEAATSDRAEPSTSEATESATEEAAPTPVATKSPQKSTKPSKEVSGRKFDLPDYAAPFLFVPAYLEVSFQTCSAIYVRHPTARPGYSEIPSPYDADGEVVRLAWEYYKGVGRRRRNVEDWGEDLSRSAGRHSKDNSSFGYVKENQVAKFDKNGKRIWAAEFDELLMEKRRMRGVRQGRGRWAHRPT